MGLRSFFRKFKARTASRERQLYAAAKIDRLTGGWMPVSRDVNSLINSSSPIVRERIRQLVRDFPPFARAVNGLVSGVVGTGIRFQSRAAGPNGEPDKKLARKIEERFQLWLDEADTAGVLHGYELQQVVQRQLCECGEYLAVERRPKRPGRHPFALQLEEPERLTDFGITPASGNKMTAGIEYDSETGEVAAYHLSDGEIFGKTHRLDAAEVLHGFQPLRPGQRRGISAFAAAVLLARNLMEYLDAEMDAAKLASKWLAFVKTPDPSGYQALRTTTDDGQKVEELENAIIEYLRPGEEIEFQSHNRPSGNFDAFTRFLLRLTAVTVDIPYEILAGDYQGMNYTVLRGVRNDYKQMLAPHIQRIVRFWRRVVYRWMDYEALTQSYLRGYFKDPWRYRRGLFIPAGMPPVDPFKEGKADIEQIKAGLKSPQQVLLSRGEDPEDVLDQIKEWQELCADRGLEFNDTAVSLALATNPAAVDGEKKLRAIK